MALRFGGIFMIYNFATFREFTDFLSNLRGGAVGEQSTIYFDDKNGKVIKIFSLIDYSDIFEKEVKIQELAKYEKRFPKSALPEDIIMCNGRCCGYIMKLLEECTSLGKFQVKATRNGMDTKKFIDIACNLAELIQDLHSEGIVIGDFHPDQFMEKNEEVYVCDTDTWGISNTSNTFEADRVGQEPYIDPLARDFKKENLFVTRYSQDTDYFSLAVVIFEMITGKYPFIGRYKLVPDYNQSLKALNHISIIGNHDFENIPNFSIENVAWMSTELQKDFLKIFEGTERFNILPSLKVAKENLKKCNQGHYYNSERYSKCPVCNPSEQTSIDSFRINGINSVRCEKYAMFPKNDVRKVINHSTYFDYSNNAICIKDDNTTLNAKIETKTVAFYFVGDEIKVSLERVGRIKQWAKVLFIEKYSSDEEFSKAFDECFDKNHLLCKLKVFSNRDSELYATTIIMNTARLNISGNFLFYVNKMNELIRVKMTNIACKETVVYYGKLPFIYGNNSDGDYCVCTPNNEGKLDIIINGQLINSLTNEIPIVIRYDDKQGNWCIITKGLKTAEYSCYIILSNGLFLKQFEEFSFRGLNLKNIIYYNKEIVIPAYKKVLFLKSRNNVTKSKVKQIDCEVIDENSKIFMVKDDEKDETFLYVQNSGPKKKQVYKFRMLSK